MKMHMSLVVILVSAFAGRVGARPADPDPSTSVDPCSVPGGSTASLPSQCLPTSTSASTPNSTTTTDPCNVANGQPVPNGCPVPTTTTTDPITTTSTMTSDPTLPTPLPVVGQQQDPVDENDDSGAAVVVDTTEGLVAVKTTTTVIQSTAAPTPSGVATSTRVSGFVLGFAGLFALFGGGL